MRYSSNQLFSFFAQEFFFLSLLVYFFLPMFIINFGIGINGGRPQIETSVLKDCLLYFGHNLRSLDLTAQNVDVTILAVLAQLKSALYSIYFSISHALQIDYFFASGI